MQDTTEADFEFAEQIKGGAVPKEYIPGVQKGIESVLSSGPIAGFPVLGKTLPSYSRTCMPQQPRTPGTGMSPTTPMYLHSHERTHHTGMKATLIDGAYHDVDSSVMAFEIAGRMACREGLRKPKTRNNHP